MKAPVTFPDGKTRACGIFGEDKPTFSLIDTGKPGTQPGTHLYRHGEMQYARIKRAGKGYIVCRERAYGDEWGVWIVPPTTAGWDLGKRTPRPTFAPELVAHAVEHVRAHTERWAAGCATLPPTDHNLARLMDLRDTTDRRSLCGWDDSKLWLYLTDQEGEYCDPDDDRPNRFWRAAGIDDAVRLVRKARRIVERIPVACCDGTWVEPRWTDLCETIYGPGISTGLRGQWAGHMLFGDKYSLDGGRCEDP